MNRTHVHSERDEDGFKEVRIITRFKPDPEASSIKFNNLPKTGKEAIEWIITDLQEMIGE